MTIISKANGWNIIEVTDRLIVITGSGEPTEDERVEIYTTADDGWWHRTYVEAGGHRPHVSTERVSSPRIH